MKISKDGFYNQVNSINLMNMGLDIKDFDCLYSAADESVDKRDINDIRITIDKILKHMFAINNTLSEPVVPLNFLDTQIGRAILKVRFGLNTGVYLVSDLVELTGYSVQYINQEALRGNIKGEQRGRTWIFSAENVEEYMIKKGFWKDIVYYPEQEETLIGGYEREEKYE